MAEICTEIVNARLGVEDKKKLEALAAHGHRTLSETIRTLVRLAQPVDVQPFTFRKDAK